MPLMPEPLPSGPRRPALPSPLLQLESPVAAAPSDGLPRLATALHRQRWLLASLVGIFVVLGAAATWLLPRHYVAEGSIIVDPPNRSLANVTAEPAPLTYDEDRTLQTEMTILASRAVALPVIRQLHLETRDRAIRESLAAAAAAARRKRRRLSPAVADQIAADVFAHQLTVVPDKLSRTVHVEFNAEDPALAAAVVNATLQQFIGYGRSQRAARARQANPWLEQQIARVGRRRQQDEQAMVAYQEAHAYTPLLVPGGQQNVLLARLADANRDLGTAETARITSAADLRAYPGNVEDLPTGLRTPDLNAAVTARDTAATELERLESIYQPNFPLVVAARNRLQTAQSHLDALGGQVTSELEKQYQTAADRQQQLQQLVDQLSHQAASEGTVETQYEILKQRVTADQALYDTLRQKLNQEQLLASLPTSSVRLLDPAQPPLTPAYPKLPEDLGLGLVLGLVCGVGAALGRERWKDTLTGVDQLRDRMGGAMTPLAVIPDHRRMLDAVLKELPPGEAAPAEEGYARMAAQLMARARQLPLAMLLTSANPGDGKTLTTCRLGQALARAGWRTLVVDADPRRPGCHAFFGVSNAQGLMAAQQGEKIAPVTVMNGLDLMPCENACSQPLQPRRLATLLEQWRETYDCVLFDTPPAMLTGEAVLLAPLVDGVVTVVHWGHTRAEDARRLSEDLARTGTPMLGSVLNRADPSAPVFRYYRRHYGYFNAPAVVR